jgi:tetratricopeptide (TPR) repeat protein
VDLRRQTLPRDHLDTLAAQEKLADFLNIARRKSKEAEPLAKQTYEARARILGASDLDTLDSMDTYATALRGQRKLAQAEKIARSGWQICKKRWGMGHERTLIDQNNLAVILNEMGHWPKAEELLRQCFEIRSKRPNGMEKQDTFIVLSNLCLVQFMQGTKLDEIENNLRQAVRRMARTHGKYNIVRLNLRHVLVRVLLEKKNYREAESLANDNLDGRREVLQVGNEDIGRSLMVLGEILAEQKKFDQARPRLEEAATLFHQNYGNRKDRIAEAEDWLGVCLVADGRFKKAEVLLLRSYELLQADPGVPKRYKEAARRHIVQLYQAWGKPDEAAAWQAMR